MHAHGFNDTNVLLTIQDIQTVLPALLYTIENPGCQRQSLPLQRGLSLDGY